MSNVVNVSMALGPLDPATERFTNRTYALLEKFSVDPTPLNNIAIMASDFLLETYGPAARWRDLEVDALIARLDPMAPMFAGLIDRHRRALAEFARFADEHEGIELDPPTGDGTFITPLSVEDQGPFDRGRSEAPPNRAERRAMARQARRARRR